MTHAQKRTMRGPLSLSPSRYNIITEAINGALPSARCTGVRLYTLRIKVGIRTTSTCEPSHWVSGQKIYAGPTKPRQWSTPSMYHAVISGSTPEEPSYHHKSCPLKCFVSHLYKQCRHGSDCWSSPVRVNTACLHTHFRQQRQQKYTADDVSRHLYAPYGLVLVLTFRIL